MSATRESAVSAELLRVVLFGGFAAAAALLAAAAIARGQRSAAPAQPRVQSTSTSPFSKFVGPARGLADLVGNTALVELRSLAGPGYVVHAKTEFLNPCGSGKDRVALVLVREAEATGVLRPGGWLVEGSSGSTGLSLAQLALALGYRCLVVLPSDVAIEKRELLAAARALVEVVPPASYASPGHYVNVARARAGALAATEAGGALFIDQFEAPGNARAHYAGTGAEIWAQTRGTVRAFVCGAGTGGTLAGVGAYLREHWAAAASEPQGTLLLVDPPGSSLLNATRHGVAWAPEQAESRARRHRVDTVVEGVGCDRVTANFARALALPLDGALRCADAEAVDMARYLLAHEGLFLGSSSALNCVGAVKAGRRLAAEAAARAASAEGAAAAAPPAPLVVVTLLCDSGARHMSRFWSDEALAARGLAAGPLRAYGDLSFVRDDASD